MLSEFQGLKKSKIKILSKPGDVKKEKAPIHFVVLKKTSEAKSHFPKDIPSWVKTSVLKSDSVYKKIEGEKGYTVFVFPHNDKSRSEFDGKSEYSRYRDVLGQTVKFWQNEPKASFSFDGVSAEALKGAVVGLKMASYNYKKIVTSDKATEFSFYVKDSSLKAKDINSIMKDGHDLANSVNIARHLVNTPPNHLHPESYAKFCQDYLGKSPGVTLKVWDEKKLKAEKMNLLLAVGRAAVSRPRLVQIKYRPRKGDQRAPIVFVGKGVTYDSGGVNLKPSSSARYMKKDMGGSASVFGLANWVIQSKLDQPCDFYLGLVENSLGSDSFRPGDIVTSRSGKTVEIDNTDAEGRLVLADILSYVSDPKQKKPPQLIVDMATLTGASRVALGYDVGALYSTDSKVAQEIEGLSLETGDPVWHMPLIPRCKRPLSSPFADIANSAGGVGGAIRATTFLQEFVLSSDIPWVHFDINAWTDDIRGGYAQKGGNGQLVQAMSAFLSL